MAEQERLSEHDAALPAQLRLFCQLMLGSPEAADRMLEQLYRRAVDHLGEPDCVHLFRIAADLCGIRR